MIGKQSLFDKVAHRGIFTPLEATQLLYFTTLEGRYNGDGKKDLISDYQLKEICSFELPEDSILFRQYCEILDNFILVNVKAETDIQLVYALVLQTENMRSECVRNFLFGNKSVRLLKNGISDFVAFSPIHNKHMSYREVFDTLSDAYSMYIAHLCIALCYNFILGEMIPLTDILGIQKLHLLKEVRNTYAQEENITSATKLFEDLLDHKLLQEIIKLNVEGLKDEVLNRFQGEYVNVGRVLDEMPSNYFSRCIVDYGLAEVE